MSELTRDLLLSRTKRRLKKITIGDSLVYIRSWSEVERSTWEIGGLDTSGQVDPKRLSGQRRRAIILSLCNEKGELMFKSGEEDLLADMDSAITSGLYKAVLKHNGFDDADLSKLDPGESAKN
jgi:hypothetical protein